MAKGFGPQSEEEGISFASGVSARTGMPFIHMSWGKNKAQFTPTELREHAMGLMEAAAAAELDACLTTWAIQKLGMSDSEAATMLLLFREKRLKGKLPSMTLNIDGDHMRPNTVKQAAKDLLYMAFNTEVEGFLVSLMVEDIGQSAEAADKMIQEFREMRGLQTMWPESKMEED